MAANAFGTNAPPTDAWLDETEHILQDYVSLMNKHRLTATNQ